MSTSSSAPSSSAPAQPRPHYGRWIALAVAVLLAVVVYRFGQPVYSTLSFMVGWPHHPGCTTTVPREETIGELWYRISEQGCANGLTMHYVFVARAQSTMSFLVTPAFMSIETPVPRSVTKHGARSYYIAIEPPLADGSDILETFIGPSGVPLTVHIYDRGQKRPTR